MAASINLKVTSDFAQASADLKKFNKNFSQPERDKILKTMKAYEAKGIKTFTDRTKKATIAIRATSGELVAAKAETNKYKKEIERLIRAGINPNSKALKPLIARYRELEKELKDNAKAQKKTTSTGVAALKNFIGISAAIMAARKAMQLFIKSSKDFADYSKTLANINTLLDITTSEMKSLDFELGQVSKEFAIQKTELSAGIYQAVSAGAEDLSAALEIVTASAQLAKGGLIENAQAVDIVTTAMNAYGSEVVSANEATDIFFNIIKEGKINGEELSQTIGNSITIFASAKISMEELGAGISAMTKVGVKAANATTQLNSIVTAFIKPSVDMTKALKEQGFASGGALLESEGLAGALKFLREQTGGNIDEMGKLVPNIRGLKGVMALAAEEGAVFNEVLETFEDVSGLATEAALKQTEGFAQAAFEIDQAKINMENLSIEMGERFLPTAAKFLKFFGDMSETVTDAFNASDDLEAIISDFEDGVIDTTFSLGQLNNIMDNYGKGMNKELKKQLVVVQALIDAYGVQDAFITQAADRELAAINKIASERAKAAQAVIDRIAAEKVLTDANISAGEELEKMRQAALSADEKRLIILQSEIDRLVILKRSAREMGTEWDAIERLLIASITEKNEILANTPELIADEITAINGVMTAEDVLAQARQDEYEILLGREENRKRLREEEIDGIEAVAAKEKEALEERIALYESYSSAVMGIFNAIDDLQSAKSAAELQRLEESGASEEELAQRKKEIAREEAIRGKKIALFEVAINTASAIVASFPNLALMALAAITGGIQAAAINAQPIPTAQTGTASPIIVPDTGRHDNVAVMAGAGEQVSVTPRGEAGMTQNISVSLNDQVLIDFVNDNIESGDIRITTDNIQGGIAV